MEFIFEFILEFIVEFVFDDIDVVSKCNKIPKYVRYPLIAIALLFFIGVVGVIVFEGIMLLKENVLIGMFFILVGLFIFIMCIIKIRNLRNKKRNMK